MHAISMPPRPLLRRWLDLVEERPDLLDASRYLVLGHELSEILKLPAPSADVLTGLLRALREDEPDALAWARDLARHSSPGRRALLELAADELIEAAYEWQHPSQVLERPRPEYRELLSICERRCQEAGDGARGHVQGVVEKVARAARIAEEARRNRQRLRRGRRRVPR